MKKQFFFWCGLGLLLVSCATVPGERGLGIRQASVQLESRDSRHTFRAEFPDFPMMVLRGEAVKNPEGSWTLTVMELDWFSNWNGGWTQAVFDLDVQGQLTWDGHQGFAVWTGDFSLPVLSKASLRYGSEYLVSDRALVQVQHRWDRIVAVVDFLKKKHPQEGWDLEKARQFLFPEVYGWGTQSSIPYEGATTVRAESVDWNTRYTQAAFPKELQVLRDSGTLLRDLEEAPQLAALVYDWKTFWEQKTPVSVLKE